MCILLLWGVSILRQSSIVVLTYESDRRIHQHACAYDSARRIFRMYLEVWLNCECVCKYLWTMQGICMVNSKIALPVVCCPCPDSPNITFCPMFDIVSLSLCVVNLPLGRLLFSHCSFFLRRCISLFRSSLLDETKRTRESCQILENTV